MTELDDIVNQFRIDLFDVADLNSENATRILCVNFTAKDDNGATVNVPLIALVVNNTTTPRDFTRDLRDIADKIDAYWHKACPTASTVETQKGAQL